MSNNKLKDAEKRLEAVQGLLVKCQSRINMYKNDSSPKSYVALCKVTLLQREVEFEVDAAYREWESLYRSSR